MPKHQSPTRSAKKDPAAVALGRRGGLKGGKARMAQLSPEERSALASAAGKARAASQSAKERSEQARKAVLARWGKAKSGEKK